MRLRLLWTRGGASTYAPPRKSPLNTALLAFYQSDYSASRALTEESLAIYTELGFPGREAQSMPSKTWLRLPLKRETIRARRIL